MGAWTPTTMFEGWIICRAGVMCRLFRIWRRGPKRESLASLFLYFKQSFQALVNSSARFRSGTRTRKRQETPGKDGQTSNSQSVILPKTSCLPNFSFVTLGLEMPNATLAKKRASSLTFVAARMALDFFSSIRARLFSVVSCKNSTRVPVMQKLQWPQPSLGTVSSSPKCRASSRLRHPPAVEVEVTRSITRLTRCMSLFSLASISA